mgnify:CR=1
MTAERIYTLGRPHLAALLLSTEKIASSKLFNKKTKKTTIGKAKVN